MRSLLLVAAGFLLCLLLGGGITAYLTISHPLGAVTNYDYTLVQIGNDDSKERHELRKGESRLLPYGEYTVTIPEIKTAFVLFKNNRGTCDIHAADQLPVIEVNENASVMGGLRESDIIFR